MPRLVNGVKLKLSNYLDYLYGLLQNAFCVLSIHMLIYVDVYLVL